MYSGRSGLLLTSILTLREAGPAATRSALHSQLCGTKSLELPFQDLQVMWPGAGVRGQLGPLLDPKLPTPRSLGSWPLAAMVLLCCWVSGSSWESCTDLHDLPRVGPSKQAQT